MRSVDDVNEQEIDVARIVMTKLYQAPELGAEDVSTPAAEDENERAVTMKS
jgi:hypothetical protein